jgi:hypothetical protein
VKKHTPTLIKSAIAIAAAAGLTLAATLPASADDFRGSSRTCGSLINIYSTTVNPGGAFSNTHDWTSSYHRWFTPGYHAGVSGIYSGTFYVYTTGSISSFGSNCSGIS